MSNLNKYDQTTLGQALQVTIEKAPTTVKTRGDVEAACEDVSIDSTTSMYCMDYKCDVDDEVKCDVEDECMDECMDYKCDVDDVMTMNFGGGMSRCGDSWDASMCKGISCGSNKLDLTCDTSKLFDVDEIKFMFSFADAATTPDDRRDRLRRLEGGDFTCALGCERFHGYGTMSSPYGYGQDFTYGKDFQYTCLPEAVCTDALLTQSLPGGVDLVAVALNDAMRDMPTTPAVRAMPDPAPVAPEPKVDYYGSYKKIRDAMVGLRLRKRA